MKIVPVVRKAILKNIYESYEDILYWLSRTPKERVTAVTQLRAGSLSPGERMDKTVVIKKKLHP